MKEVFVRAQVLQEKQPSGEEKVDLKNYLLYNLMKAEQDFLLDFVPITERESAESDLIFN